MSQVHAWKKGKQDINLLTFYRRMCLIRTVNKCLVYGAFKPVVSDILAYCRIYGDTGILVLINSSDKSVNFTDAGSSEQCEDLIRGGVLKDLSNIIVPENEFRLIKYRLRP